MLTTHTRIALAVLLVGVAAAAPEPALARAKMMHRYTSTIQSEPLSTGNGYPSLGGTLLNTGSFDIRPFGAGALVDHVTITGHPASNAFDFDGTEVDYFDNGTWRAIITGTATVQPDGSQRVTATGRFTGGTDRYSGATGYFIYNGSVPAGSTVLSGHSAGWVAY